MELTVNCPGVGRLFSPSFPPLRFDEKRAFDNIEFAGRRHDRGRGDCSTLSGSEGMVGLADRGVALGEFGED